MDQLLNTVIFNGSKDWNVTHGIKIKNSLPLQVKKHSFEADPSNKS